MTLPTTLIWFKRDLRVQDHAPLAVAAERGAVLPLYVVEPGYWQLDDVASRHWRVLRPALAELREALAALGQPLVVREGEVCAVLDALHRALPFDALYAHEETGNADLRPRPRGGRLVPSARRGVPRVAAVRRGPWLEAPRALGQPVGGADGRATHAGAARLASAARACGAGAGRDS
ncbi:MAG: deoxyribodipyrimidine photo-lyase [Lysobacterales bacterium]|jgi:deoxyribodipyrimidine photo-lyase